MKLIFGGKRCKGLGSVLGSSREWGIWIWGLVFQDEVGWEWWCTGHLPNMSFLNIVCTLYSVQRKLKSIGRKVPFGQRWMPIAWSEMWKLPDRMEAGSVQTTSPLRFLYKPYKKVDMRRRKTFSDHAAVQRSEWKEKKQYLRKERWAQRLVLDVRSGA